MAAISSLFVELKLSAESFNNDLRQAAREAKEFEKSIRPSKEAAEELGLAMSAAGALIVGGMLAATKSAVDFGDHINDLNKMTGVSTENLSKLGFAAEQSGSSLDGMATGLRFLSKNMEAAIGGSKEQQTAFAALGISAKDLSAAHGDVNKVLLLLADRFKELPDGAEKSALSMKIFGKSGADMIPLLDEGSAGIRRMGDEAERTGAIVSAEFAAKADQFNDTLVKVKAAAMGVSIGIADALLPTLQSLADTVKDTGGELAAFTKGHEDLTRAVALAAGAIGGTGGLLLALTGVLQVLPQLREGFALMGGAAGAATVGGILALTVALIELADAGEKTKKAHQDSRQAEIDLGNQTQKLADQVAAAGGPLIRAHGTLQQWNAEVIAAAKGIKDLNPELSANVKAHNEAAAAQAAHTKALMDHVEWLAKAAERQRVVEKERLDFILAAGKEVEDAYKREEEQQVDAIKAALAEVLAAEKQFETEQADAIHAALKEVLDDEARAMAERVALIKGAAQEVLDIEARAEKERVDLILGAGKEVEEGYKKSEESIKGLATAMGNVTSDFAKGVTDVIFEGKRMGEALEDIAVNTAKNMMNAFLVGLFSPLTDELTRAGKALGSLLLSAVGGGTGGGIGGAAGGIGGAAGLGGLGGLGAAGIIGGAALGGYALVKAFQHDPEFHNFRVDYHDGGYPQYQYFDKPITAKDADALFKSRGGSLISYYEHGTPYVSETGPAIVHEGERIVNRSDNDGLIAILSQIRDLIARGGTIHMDSMQVGRAVGPALYALTRNEGLVITGAR